MVTGIIGKKVGMTQIFEADGSVYPATVIKAGPCVVVQAKTAATDGYESVQLGLVEDTPAKVGKPMAGHYKKANVPPTRVRREVALSAGGDALKAGDQVLVSHFASGAATHGSMFHPAPASIGASSFPSRVIKGMRAAGRMGGGRVTIHNLKVLRVDPENHLLIVEGGIPGAPSSYVIVRKAVTAKKVKVAQVEKPKKGKK